LIRLTASHPDWVLGFEDEVWWSRVSLPALHAWSDATEGMRLLERRVAKEDPDPKALACYGLLVRLGEVESAKSEQVWLRFVEGRPVSGQTIQYLEWCGEELAALGKSALLLVWDNASWHKSEEVRRWIKGHNREVKRTGKGVRIVGCRLPSKSLWLNPIEPRWTHGKRRVVEPARLLSAAELIERVYDAYDCPHRPLLPMPQKVA
jgi:DDE superfamily endonuclease